MPALTNILMNHPNTHIDAIIESLKTNLQYLRTRPIQHIPQPRNSNTSQKRREPEGGAQANKRRTHIETETPHHNIHHTEWKLVDAVTRCITSTFQLQDELFTSSISHTNTTMRKAYSIMDGDTNIHPTDITNQNALDAEWTTINNRAWCNPGFTASSADPNNTISNCLSKAIETVSQQSTQAIRFIVVTPHEHCDIRGQAKIDSIIHARKGAEIVARIHTPPETILFMDSQAIYDSTHTRMRKIHIPNNSETIDIPCYTTTPPSPAINLVLIQNEKARRQWGWNTGGLKYNLDSILIALNPDTQKTNPICEVQGITDIRPNIENEYRQTKTNWPDISWTAISQPTRQTLTSHTTKLSIRYRATEAITAARLGTMSLDPARHLADVNPQPYGKIHTLEHYTQPHPDSIKTDENFCKGYKFKPKTKRNMLKIISLKTRGLILKNPLTTIGFAQGKMAKIFIKETNRKIIQTLKKQWKSERQYMKSEQASND